MPETTRTVLEARLQLHDSSAWEEVEMALPQEVLVSLANGLAMGWRGTQNLKQREKLCSLADLDRGSHLKVKTKVAEFPAKSTIATTQEDSIVCVLTLD